MLTPSENLLWHCARTWRSPDTIPLPRSVDWEHAVALAIDNKMAPLLHGYLEAKGALQELPPLAQAQLRQETTMYDYRARLFGAALQQFLHYAAHAGLDVVVLKGLWLSIRVYGQAHVRPGGDIDLLLRERDVPAALRILEYEMGYGRWWRPIMHDRYYTRHHLHQQRCNPGRAIWFEPHWRLDHPYTLLTFDYEAMMARTAAGELLGQPVRELALPDLLLSLAVHLVKHAIYLPATCGRTDLARLILADGMLMYFVDVAEILKQFGAAFPWDETIRQAGKTGTTTLLGAVLRVCADYLEAPVPAWVRHALPVTAPPPLTQKMMAAMAAHILNRYAGRKTPGLWHFLVGYQETVIFRPIRLLDLLHYCFPGADYLQRRYGSAGRSTSLLHTLRALGQYARVGVDTVYYTWQRQQRLRHLNPEELALCDARYDPLLPKTPQPEPGATRP